MALREIRLDGDPILRKKSREVSEISERVLELLDDMVETMREANGLGLAAPQIGVLKRIIVLDIGEEPIKAINPVIIEEEGIVSDLEGCLSVPNFSGYVDRPEKIKVTFLNEKGEKLTYNVEGYPARVFCHEIDHLNGILYTDIASEVIENTQEDDE